jgi:hypothetical protein
VEQEKEQPKPKVSKKLVLNKETIRVLTEEEMAQVEGATCGNRRSTCPDYYTIPPNALC